MDAGNGIFHAVLTLPFIEATLVTKRTLAQVTRLLLLACSGKFRLCDELGMAQVIECAEVRPHVLLNPNRIDAGIDLCDYTLCISHSHNAPPLISLDSNHTHVIRMTQA